MSRAVRGAGSPRSRGWFGSRGGAGGGPAVPGRVRLAACGAAAAALLGGCDGGTGSAGGDPTASASVSAPASASATASPKPKPTVVATAKPTVKPTLKPTLKPTPKPTAKPVTGTPMSAANAFLQVSEDPNLTTPDPENGCEAHDPDLTVTGCNVAKMAGGTLTWVVGYEKTNAGPDEERMVVRLYRRLPGGDDEMTHVAFSEPGDWAGVRVRTVSLTGQTSDTIVVEITFRGTGTFKGYDLLTWRKGTGGPALVAHHDPGGKGVVRVENRAVHFYAADYSDGAPNCCPTKYTHDRAQWDPAIKKFRLAKLPPVKQPPS